MAEGSNEELFELLFSWLQISIVNFSMHLYAKNTIFDTCIPLSGEPSATFSKVHVKKFIFIYRILLEVKGLIQTAFVFLSGNQTRWMIL